MKKSDFVFILQSFLIWRIILLLIVFIAPYFFPLQKHFLGGGLQNYLSAPWFWGWANFDGEHYLSIAQRGYGFGEQAFFPLYPWLIKLLGNVLGGGLSAYAWAGLAISNLSFVLALVGLYKLIRIDFQENIAKLVIILLLVFPASFYFGSVYTESVFLALVVWSFYFARRQRWFLVAVLGMFASATRVVGILLLPVLAIRKRSFWLLLIPFGLLAYMIFLRQTTGDPLKFLHALPSFGEQRSATPILLPQVFYRYIFKILPNLNYNYFPVVFSTLLEFIVAILFLGFSVLSFFRLRLSYTLFLALGYLLPTLSGSFSSLPRYVLVLFPAFLLVSIYLSKASKTTKLFTFFILFVFNAISFMLFIRGYWLA